MSCSSYSRVKTSAKDLWLALKIGVHLKDLVLLNRASAVSQISMRKDSVFPCAKMPLRHGLKAVDYIKGISIKYWLDLEAYFNRDARRFREMKRSWFWARHRDPVFTYPEKQAHQTINYATQQFSNYSRLFPAQIQKPKWQLKSNSLSGNSHSSIEKRPEHTVSVTPRHIKQYLGNSQ